MEERRQYAIFFGHVIVFAKMIDWMESDKPTMAKQIWVENAIREVEFILERIDERWPEDR